LFFLVSILASISAHSTTIAILPSRTCRMTRRKRLRYERLAVFALLPVTRPTVFVRCGVIGPGRQFNRDDPAARRFITGMQLLSISAAAAPLQVIEDIGVIACSSHDDQFPRLDALPLRSAPWQALGSSRNKESDQQ
jgi:hypothetical protein